MKAAVATLTHSSSLQIDPPLHLLTSTGRHKPAFMITINPRRSHIISFHQPSPSLFPSGNLQAMCGHKFPHVVKAAVGMSGGNGGGDDNDVKKKRGAVGAGVVLACVIGAICLTRPMCPPALAIWPFSSQTQTEGSTLDRLLKAQTQTEGSTLDRLLKAAEIKRPEKDADNLLNDFTRILNQERIEYQDLKEAGTKLALSSKGAAALTQLRNKYEKSRESNRPEAYELGLARVEMLILRAIHREAERKDRLAEAEGTINDLLDLQKVKETALKSMTNTPLYADLMLFKAVISMMREKKDDAKDWFDAYEENYLDPSNSVHTKIRKLKEQLLELKKKEIGK